MQQVKALRQEKRLETERNLLIQLDSDFVCRLYSVHEDSTAYYLLLELVQGGELQKLIHSRSGESKTQDETRVQTRYSHESRPITPELLQPRALVFQPPTPTSYVSKANSPSLLPFFPSP